MSNYKLRAKTRKHHLHPVIFCPFEAFFINKTSLFSSSKRPKSIALKTRPFLADSIFSIYDTREYDILCA